MILDDGLGRRLGKPHEKMVWVSDLCSHREGAELVLEQGLALQSLLRNRWRNKRSSGQNLNPEKTDLDAHVNSPYIFI